jgi:hypothetical protein
MKLCLTFKNFCNRFYSPIHESIDLEKEIPEDDYDADFDDEDDKGY